MKVLNIHTRVINQPKSTVARLLDTLATKNDQVWPQEKWPPIRFREGLQIGAKGGHGPIRYTVTALESGRMARFTFSRPEGFDGTHELEINSLNAQQTQIKHTIAMKTHGKAVFLWLFAIRWLHDALIEDAFDKVENQFSDQNKHTEWNLWVKLLRWGMKRR